MGQRSWVRIWQHFLLGVSANWLSQLGAALTTGSFLLLILFQLLGIAGILTNPYFDMIAFLTLPSLMVGGLIFVAIGWWILVRQTSKDGGSIDLLLKQRFGEEQLRGGAWGTRLLWTVLALTIVNLLFLGGVSAQAKSFMDSREFCGTACHVMNPEWVAYQSGPHAGVDCVDCHVGEGMGAFIEAKIGGARQLWHFVNGTYSRPVPTPVHQFRSADETCARCHNGDRDHGEKLVFHERFAHTPQNEPQLSALRLKMGGGSSKGIHTHARSDWKITFASKDNLREEMHWVEVERADGSKERFVAPNGASAFNEAEVRKMDCVDCHNRTGHPFSRVEDALDRAMAAGRIDTQIEGIKDKSYGLLTGATPRSAPGDSPTERISLALKRYLLATDPHEYHRRPAQVEAAAQELGRIYSAQVHPAMNIEWDTYPSQIGHRGTSDGCFRCHNDRLKSEQGNTISGACELCHDVLADGARLELNELMVEPSRPATAKTVSRKQASPGGGKPH